MQLLKVQVQSFVNLPNFCYYSSLKLVSSYIRQVFKIQKTVKTLFVSWDTESEAAEGTQQPITNLNTGSLCNYLCYLQLT
jgi:hypothetical protein